jgi:hypothetical protein
MTTAFSSSKDVLGTSQESGNQTLKGKWMDVPGKGCFHRIKLKLIIPQRKNGQSW